MVRVRPKTTKRLSIGTKKLPSKEIDRHNIILEIVTTMG